MTIPTATSPATCIASPSRAHAGHGIGAQLVEHAAQLVADSGQRWLRLDCAKHRKSVALFQRELTRRQTSAPAHADLLPVLD
jgi:GNAT superfamily N-acetyltransferase